MRPRKRGARKARARSKLGPSKRPPFPPTDQRGAGHQPTKRTTVGNSRLRKPYRRHSLQGLWPTWKAHTRPNNPNAKPRHRFKRPPGGSRRGIKPRIRRDSRGRFR